jgi:hypothetical protein
MSYPFAYLMKVLKASTETILPDPDSSEIYRGVRGGRYEMF